MSGDITTYSGSVTETIINFTGEKISELNTSLGTLQLPNLPIIWDNNSSPPGWSPNTLLANIPGGYAVMYETYYAVSGNWKSLLTVGPNKLKVTLSDYFNPQTVVREDYINVNTSYAALWQDWCYGPPDFVQQSAACDSPFRVTGNPSFNVPGRIALTTVSAARLSGFYIFDLVFQIKVKITVTRDCTATNIDADICQQICQAHPSSESCFAAYTEYCFKGNVANVATPVCTNYIKSFINEKNGSNQIIDNQIANYCSAKYIGLEDYLEKTQDNLDDRALCACHIRSKTKNDPDAIVLYNNFYESVKTKYPGFEVVGYKTKCLFNECAKSAFPSADIGRQCAVANCVQFTTVDNNGNIGGNVTVDQSCNANSGFSALQILFIIIIVIVIVLLILFLLGVFSRGRKNSTVDNVDSGAYNSSVQTQLPESSVRDGIDT